VAFLPLGGDLSTAVYQAITADNTAYFCKLKLAWFDEAAVRLPKYLSDQGITAIIAPLATRDGQLWADIDDYALILYPFVVGINGYDLELTVQQWADFGAALRQIHTMPLPPTLKATIQRESYSSEWHEDCREIFRRLEEETFTDPIMVDMVAFLQPKRKMMLHAIERAEKLAYALAARPLEFVLCHTDVHAGNLFIDSQNHLFIVEWDYIILAPKERDLMFIGGGQGFMPYLAEQEERLFYQGYGDSEIDKMVLTYYRYERGIMDVTVESERILSPALGSQDRARALEYLQLYFLPGCTIEMAYKTDEPQLLLQQTKFDGLGTKFLVAD
jgi:spectinomycin phosphotransferase